MMRKALAALLTLTLLVGLTACGGGSVTSVPVDSSVSTNDVGGADRTTTTTGPLGSDIEQSTTSATGSKADVSGTSADSADKTTALSKSAATKDKNTTATNASTTVKTTTTKPTPTTTMSKEQYMAGKERITVSGSEKDLATWIYTLGKNGVRVREAVFDSGKGGAPAEIIHMTDVHFNTVNVQDAIEDNPSVIATYVQRFNSFPGSKDNIDRCMEYACYFDQIVLTGDVIDYLSWGNLELLQQRVWDRAPTALVAMGNHEPVRCMGLPNDVADPSTLESRYEMLQGVWKHNIFYTSRIVKDKAMVIQLDNGLGRFCNEQISQLEADIAKAREKGYVVLLFYHVPLDTSGVAKGDEATRKVYELITNNADVIKGTFCGHLHVNRYEEIKAKTASGQAATIPQYILEPVANYKGVLLKITVN